MNQPQGGAKVFWDEPDHDEKVAAWINVAIRQAEREWQSGEMVQRGVGVIDFQDCTVIVLSDRVPIGEVFVTQRKTENSILHGGFGAAPNRSSNEKRSDFTDNFVEIKSPDDKTTVMGPGKRKSKPAGPPQTPVG